MDHSHRFWNILCWNVRGLNDPEKWNLIRNKIDESSCSILCFQETKKENIDAIFLRNFAPRRFDSFDFCPSDGASGGILVAWNSQFFTAVTVDKQSFALSLTATSAHNQATWSVTSVYGPTREPARTNFISWLYGLDVDPDSHHLILGDFNFYRSSINRNRPGDSFTDAALFNDVINHLGLIELPLKGRSYT